MMKLAPYPEYKESGLPWLERIPAHWDETKLKRVSHVQTGVTLGKRYEKAVLVERPYLRVANVQNGFLNLKHIKTIAVPDKEAGSAELRNGDVVITEGGDIDKLGRGAIWNGEIEHCLHQNHIFAIRPVLTSLIPGFLSRMMESHHGRTYFYLTSKRTTNLASTNQTTLGLLPLFLPKIEEQTQIARFLDWKSAQINKFICNKRRFIELLKEQKQNIINQAVTRGLDPKVNFKPSGVEWIGDIPEHWEVRRLKFLARIRNGQDYKDIEAESGYPVMGSGGQFAYASAFMYEGESVLFGRKGTIDKPLYINERFWTVDTMFYTEVSKHVFAKFLYYSALSFPFDFYSTKTALPSMTQQDLGNHPVALPPKDEQQLVIQFIEEESQLFDQTITRAQREIELMREYRTRLISDVVTGQVDVRGIEVPEVAEEELLMLEEDTADADAVIDEDAGAEVEE